MAVHESIPSSPTERRGNIASNGAATPSQVDGRVRNSHEVNAALLLGGCGGGGGTSGHSAPSHGKKSPRPSLSRILLSLESNTAKQQVVCHRYMWLREFSSCFCTVA